MSRTRVFVALFATAVLVPLLAGATTAGADQGGVPNANAQFGQSHKPVCGPVPPEQARCHAEVVTDASGQPMVTPGPAGYGPADLVSAYKLPATGSGQTVAIIDAYDAPTAEQDLATYRAQFGLPPCTTANGCFKKVNQNGAASPLPAVNAGWAQETSLDLDAVSAVCPNCKLLLVEANTANFTDMTVAVDRAALMGANAISNSYGANEFSGETTYESHYNHPGIAITVSTGDAGYGTEFPASARYVTAVGGTSLNRATNARGFTETVWSGAGSGCSALIPKPSWQHDSGCGRRTVADVSAVANPNTGIAVYDSTPYQGTSGWMVFGGTSLSAPIIAGVYALAGNTSTAYSLAYTYSRSSSLFDVTSGANGHCKRTIAYLCTGGVGFDGPTGLGTPNGVGAF